MEMYMNDMEDYQIEAARYAGRMGGEFLEEIGKTDLATLSAEQWDAFVRCVCMNYATKEAELEPCPF